VSTVSVFVYQLAIQIMILWLVTPCSVAVGY